MIDFHSHILPEMDDGSSSISESLHMLRLSYDMGIDTMIASPHYFSDFESIDSFTDRRDKKMDEIIELVNIKSCPKLVTGAEVKLFSGISNVINISKLCIGNTKNMLIEMPFNEWSSSVKQEIKNLIAVRGIIPIIAHADRYVSNSKNRKIIDEFIDIGAVVQINADALTDKRKKIYLKLLRDKKIFLLGSDCHNIVDRKPNLNDALNVIKKELGQSYLDEIDSFGRKILKGE